MPEPIREEILKSVCDEIQRIAQTYREQEASRDGVSTPGGLEHMGDVWKLLLRWDARLSQPAERKGRER